MTRRTADLRIAAMHPATQEAREGTGTLKLAARQGRVEAEAKVVKVPELAEQRPADPVPAD